MRVNLYERPVDYLFYWKSKNGGVKGLASVAFTAKSFLAEELEMFPNGINVSLITICASRKRMLYKLSQCLCTSHECN